MVRPGVRRGSWCRAVWQSGTEAPALPPSRRGAVYRRHGLLPRARHTRLRIQTVHKKHLVVGRCSCPPCYDRKDMHQCITSA